MTYLRSIVSLVLVSSALSLSGCMLTDMANATKSVPEKMDETNKKVDQTNETTCTMYRSLRQGNTKVSRDTDFQAIVDAKDIEAKLPKAAAYMQGFEFQVWTDKCGDDIAREDTFDQFARELLTNMEPFISSREYVSPSNLWNTVLRGKKMDTLYALAGTLHYVNSLQGGFLQGTSESTLRPFDILVKGLEIDAQRNTGTLSGPVPAYADVVGKYSKNAIYLLRLRQNFLMAYAYSVADSNSFGDSPNMYDKTKRVLRSGSLWEPQLQNRTPTEIADRITLALTMSTETNAALVKLGIDPMIDTTFAEVWEHADFSKFDTRKPGEFSKSVKDLMAARDKIVTAAKRSSK